MSGIFVHGIGAVSPAGWGLEPFRRALASGVPIQTKCLSRPGWEKPLTVRQVPVPATRPEFLSHSRLRRASPITHHVVAAALEAISNDKELITSGSLRLGIILCVMSGCVTYSRRFYDEVLRDPATASPLLFPETVFNAPASHIAALLGTPAINYTLVGDSGTFLEGIAVAAQWLNEDRIDACVVIGAEEADWLTSDAFHLFSRAIILSDGAGAVYLKKNTAPGALAELASVTDCHLFAQGQNRVRAAQGARAQLPPCSKNHFLVDGLQNLPRMDRAETASWRDWTAPRISPKLIFGEGLMAAAAWQTVVAIDAVATSGYAAANVSVVGSNQQAIGAHFITANLS